MLEDFVHYLGKRLGSTENGAMRTPCSSILCYILEREV